MADLTLEARPAFEGLASLGLDGFTVTEPRDLAIATVSVATGNLEAANKVVLREYGVALPACGRRVSSELITFVGAGPNLWLAVAAGADDLDRELTKELGRLGLVTDASGGRAVLRMSGLRSTGILARGMPIDLHPSVFRDADVASTHCAHIAVTIWRVDDAPTFELAIPRSYAGSFQRWLAGAVASEAAAPL